METFSTQLLLNPLQVTSAGRMYTIDYTMIFSVGVQVTTAIGRLLMKMSVWVFIVADRISSQWLFDHSRTVWIEYVNIQFRDICVKLNGLIFG